MSRKGERGMPDMPTTRVVVHEGNVSRLVLAGAVVPLPEGVEFEMMPCDEPHCGEDFCDHPREARPVSP